MAAGSFVVFSSVTSGAATECELPLAAMLVTLLVASTLLVFPNVNESVVATATVAVALVAPIAAPSATPFRNVSFIAHSFPVPTSRACGS